MSNDECHNCKDLTARLEQAERERDDLRALNENAAKRIFEQSEKLAAAEAIVDACLYIGSFNCDQQLALQERAEHYFEERK